MTKCEQAVQLRDSGMTTKQVAEALNVTPKSAKSMISRGRHLASARERERLYWRAKRGGNIKPRPASYAENRDATRVRNASVISAIKAGHTYDEIAANMGITRQVVAGICYRAGVKAPYSSEKREAMAQRLAASWQDPECRARRVAALTGVPKRRGGAAVD